MSEALMTEIYNVFDPFDPPPREAYVDCKAVRGDWNVLTELGRKIIRSKGPTCQLYTGHRGVGKSTELLQLQEALLGQKYFVVYFPADSEDIDVEDTEYADILMACTKHLIKTIDLEDKKNLKPLSNWLKKIKEGLLLTPLSFEDLSLDHQVFLQMTKITATLKTQPDNRSKIREEINANTPSLLEVLNEFIDASKLALEKKGYKDLVLMVDNLDRIVEKQRSAEGLTNYDEIFIKCHEQMRGLHCHTIYTVPLAMVYSNRYTQLQNNYSETNVLPMVMLQYENGEISKAGLAAFREVIAKRIILAKLENDPQIGKKLAESLETSVFESAEILERLCLMSGGHIRLLMKMIQKALDHTDNLPISKRAVNRAIADAKDEYLNIFDDDWVRLATVYLSKQISNNAASRRLLSSRIVVEYRCRDVNENLKRWYDVHPLVQSLQQFKDALSVLSDIPKSSDTGDVDDIALAGMDNVYKLYEEALKNNDYNEVVKIADMAYKMLDNIAESLDQNKDRDTYRRIVALSSYWQLNKNLYTSRSKS